MPESSAVLAAWTITVPQDRVFTILPDGCVDLIAVHHPNGRVDQLLSGLDLGPRPVAVAAGTVLRGLRLRPGLDLRPLAVALDTSPADLVARRGAWCGPLDVDAVEALFPTIRSQSLLDGVTDAPSLAAAARAQGVSPRTLHRHLRAATGLAPAQWRALARVRRAGRRVLDGTLPLVEVAFAEGYADQAHMTRDMRRLLGVTPGLLAAGKGQDAAWLLRQPGL